jgi:gamma-glutamyltranspeptidase/glutathione hydrolase
MQPQGHVQLVRNLLDFGMSPQTALNAPRWILHRLGTTQSDRDVAVSEVFIEDCYGGRGDGGDPADCGETMARLLEARGHVVVGILRGTERELYGRGQIITRNADTGVLCAGSDPRADGCAIPVIF